MNTAATSTRSPVQRRMFQEVFQVCLKEHARQFKQLRVWPCLQINLSLLNAVKLGRAVALVVEFAGKKS